MKTLFEVGTVTMDDGRELTAVAGNKVVLNVMFGAMAIGSTAFVGIAVANGVKKIQAAKAAAEQKKELEEAKAVEETTETTEEQQ